MFQTTTHSRGTMSQYCENTHRYSSQLYASSGPGFLFSVLLALLLTVPVSGQCPDCPTPQSNHLEIETGMTVATFFGCLDANSYVVAVYDTSNPPVDAPIDTGTGFGTDTMWVPGLSSTAQGRYTGPGTEMCDPTDPNAWTMANLGTVFGVTLDDSVPPNIYVSATALLHVNNGGAFCPVTPHFGPGGAGGVYRLDRFTGEICTVAALPATNDSVSLGQIDHVTLDNGTGILYVSNMDDGLIYAVSDNCGSDWSYTFDHGVDGRLAAGLLPIPDIAADPLTPFGRRIWGLRFNEAENRLYYAAWNTSSYTSNAASEPDPTADNEIWSVEIDPMTGEFIQNSATLEISIPSHVDWSGNRYEWPVSDIAFECGTRMIISERSSHLTNSGTGVSEIVDAHNARHLEYIGNHLGWIGSDPDKFRTGNYNSFTQYGQNSAGGVDFDPDGNVVASADALHNLQPSGPDDRIYGFAIIPSTGSNPVNPWMLDSYLIDADCDNLIHDKWWMFDVECFRPQSSSCPTTCTTENAHIQCGSATNNAEFTVTFDVVNNSGFEVHKLVIPGLVGGVTVSPNIIDLVTPLADGDTAIGIQLYLNGGTAGDIVCIPVGLMAKDATGNLFECCGTEVCVELPSCCMSISDESITSDAAGNFVYNFTVTNLSGEAPTVAEHLFMGVISPSGVTITNEWQALNGLVDGDPIALSTTINGAQPGDEICFQITIHDATLNECCGIVHCVTIPDDGTGPCLIVEGCAITEDIDADGVDDGYISWISTDPECCQELYLLHDGQAYMQVDINLGFVEILSSIGGLPSMTGTWCLGCSSGAGTIDILDCCVLPFTSPAQEFLRGDANSDGAFDIADVVKTLGFLFQGEAVPCLVALDSNDDETVDIADGVYSLQALFGGGPSPLPPYQLCGPDETFGSLGCNSFPTCDDVKD